jgi:hypothetical protein
MISDILPNLAKPIMALGVAGVTYLAETVTPSIPNVPEWVTALGLPVAFLVAVIYALVTMYGALRDSEEGRREDWKQYNDRLESLMHSSQESRERLIRATDQQTNEFRSLAQQLSMRPCQIPKNQQ